MELVIPPTASIRMSRCL